VELGHWFRDADLKLHSIHLPMYTDEYWGQSGPNAVINITEPVKSKRIAVVDEVKRAIEVAEYMPCRYAIQHLGVSGQEYEERCLDAAFSSLEELMIFARHRDVEILIENIPNQLSSAERLMHFVGITHLPLNFCLDLGHAHLNEGVADAFDILKERIRSTHVHDNDGTEDAHLFPLVAEGGTIDWKQAMKLLRSRDGQYPLLLELKEPPDMDKPLERAAEVFERLEEIRHDDE
jgi:sugar phosphate isomerase/epimerase